MEQPPNNSEVRETLDLARRLESSEDEEYIRENLPIFLEKLEETLDIKLTDDMNSLYSIMEQENCLARIESISRVVTALETGQSFEVGMDKGDSHYANAVVPEPEGIQLAFSEGQAPGPVRLMVGFGKTLVGFKTDHLEVLSVDFTEDTTDLRDAMKRQYLCRHVDGRLEKNDIRAVVMRIPRHFVKEDLITEKENKSKSQFIFRGFAMP
ncbi:MAG TPA: hypothetical protein VFA52_03130 [Candidatus Paceibacterota bacterium]|nr:hypothetical protein [Candidatus Paceibacterota bacterium]